MRKKSTNRFRRGRVTVSHIDGQAWQFRWTDPESGRDVRKRVECQTVAKAREIADSLDRAILTGEGFLPGKRSKVPLLADALEAAVKTSNQRGRSQRRSRTEGNRFIDWAEETFPRVERFDEVTPAMIREYGVFLESQGLARDSIRLALEPVRMAWRYVSENHPREMLPWPKVRLPERKPGGPVCLEPSEVRALLDWLRETGSELWPIATLAALAGLRQLEAGSLRRCDVDLERGTVAVTDTGFHVPKNRSSYRTVPVCGEVREALATWIESLPALPVGEALLFVSKAGNPWDVNRLCGAWQRTFAKARDESKARKKTGKKPLPEFWKLPPRKLRAFFGTLVGRFAVPGDVAQAYMGHTPASVYGRHYRNLDPSELLSVSSVLDGWRKVPDFGAVWQESGNLKTEAASK